MKWLLEITSILIKITEDYQYSDEIITWDHKYFDEMIAVDISTISTFKYYKTVRSLA